MSDELKTRVRALFNRAREARIPAYKIAERAGISAVTLSNWNVGNSDPTFSFLIKAEAALAELVAEKEAGK